MGLGGTDKSIDCIAAVDIWGYELVVTPKLFSENMTICNAGFIAENLGVDPVAALFEAGNNIVVRRNVMTITLRLRGFYVYGFSVAVVGDHDVLITTAIVDREPAHIISVEFADVGYLDVQFFGGDRREGFNIGGLRHWHENWLLSKFRISGAKELTRLGHVSFWGFDGAWTILC